MTEKIVEDAITDDAREAERVTDGVIDDGDSETRLGDWLKDNELIDLDRIIVECDKTLLRRQRERFLW